eukprot:4856409-Amphidinium_carterae.1
MGSRGEAVLQWPVLRFPLRLICSSDGLGRLSGMCMGRPVRHAAIQHSTSPAPSLPAVSGRGLLLSR